MTNENAVSVLCSKLAFASSASAVCNNINYICNLLKSNRHDLVNMDCNEITKRLMCLYTRPEDEILCNVIKDCIIMKDERSSMFTYSELQFMIKTLCTE